MLGLSSWAADSTIVLTRAFQQIPVLHLIFWDVFRIVLCFNTVSRNDLVKFEKGLKRGYLTWALFH